MKTQALIAGLVAAMASLQARAVPITAAVLRSSGTYSAGDMIWGDLNSGWSAFGSTPVQIDYSSLAGQGITLPQIQAAAPDVLVISGGGAYTDSETNAIVSYVQAGHGLIATWGVGPRGPWEGLLGLAQGVGYSGGYLTDPTVRAVEPDSPLFDGISAPYLTGSPTFVTGPVLQEGTLAAYFQHDIAGQLMAIVTNETATYRGVYFAYGIDYKAGGANTQDVQVFYNALLWSAVPEPATGATLSAAAGFCLLRSRRRVRR